LYAILSEYDCVQGTGGGGGMGCGSGQLYTLVSSNCTEIIVTHFNLPNIGHGWRMGGRRKVHGWWGGREWVGVSKLPQLVA